MGSIVAYRTYDTAKIMAVLLHPDIIKTISEDGCGKLEINVDGTCFIACDIDGITAAVFIFDKLGAHVVDVHAHVLPANRQHSKDIGAAILSHFFTIAPWATKLNALIPTCYPNVIAFAQHFGFINEGINRKSYLHNGDLIDQVYLGATRQEVLNGLY